MSKEQLAVKEASARYAVSVTNAQGVPPGYKQTEVGVIPEDWEVKKLGDFVSFQRGHDLTESERRKGDVPVMGSAGCSGFHDTAIAKGPGVVIGRSGASFGQAHFCENDYWPHNTALYVTDFRGNDPLFSYYFLKSMDFSRYNSGGAQQSLNRNFINPIPIGVPCLPEQRAIAAALSDVDALIAALDKLIAKKRAIKTAAMQQLLTGKKRLPGFSGEWKVKAFDQAFIRQNAKNSQIQTSEYSDFGIHPVIDQGKTAIVAYSDRSERLFRCPSDGVIVFGDHTCIVKFVDFDFLVGADGTQLLKVREGNSTKFFYYILCINEVPSTGYNRHFKFLKEKEFLAPSLSEQTAIAAVLSDMDAEIAALEARRDKTKAIKQGMIQELLTGKTRLIENGQVKMDN